MSQLLLPSLEQADIIACVTQGNNVVVDAVAGSGKTTTVLSIARSLGSNYRVLQITYNKQLKNEVREKALVNNIDNIEIHTYHSLAVKYYSRTAHTDASMKKALSIKKKLRYLPYFDVIVIDEAQDMTMLYYELVNRFISDSTVHQKPPTIVVFGDRYQGMYEFKGADVRFLTLAADIWSHRGCFRMLPMKTSYRVTKEIAWFVNNCMLGNERLYSNKKGCPVEYYKCNPFNAHNKIIPELVKMLQSGDITQDDIFVLAFSLKSKTSPPKMLENALVRLGLKCYLPTSDDAKIDDEIIKGKIVFSTFHQAKGRERSVVIVYGFDDSHFKFFEKKLPTDVCPSTLYVAATRASKRLFLIESNMQNANILPFLKMSHIQMKQATENICLHFDTPNESNKTPHQHPRIHRTSPTELIKYMTQETIEKLEPMISQIFRVTNPPGEIINIPAKAKMISGHYEEVWDINGLVIPAIWEARRNNGISTIQHFIVNYTQDPVFQKKHTYLDLHAKDFRCNKSPTSIAEFLRLGNVYHSVRNEVYHKLAQIDMYDWLTDDMVSACHANLQKHLPASELQFETQLETTENVLENFKRINKLITANVSDLPASNVEIKAIVDVFDNDTVWELKCAKELTIEHCIQVVIYAWLWRNSMVDKYGFKRFVLMNICSEEIRELDVDSPIIDDIVYCVIQEKFREVNKKNDIVFVENCKSVARLNDF